MNFVSSKSYLWVYCLIVRKSGKRLFRPVFLNPFSYWNYKEAHFLYHDPIRICHDTDIYMYMYLHIYTQICISMYTHTHN